MLNSRDVYGRLLGRLCDRSRGASAGAVEAVLVGARVIVAGEIGSLSVWEVIRRNAG